MSRKEAHLQDSDRRRQDWELARKGIQLILNNKYEDALKIFENREDSIPLSAGYLFTIFMNAAMSFDDAVLTLSLNTLKDLETRCSQNLGWLRTFKNKVFGNYNDVSPYELLEQQITLADTQVCHAVLYMMTEDSTAGLVKGAWALRKAWGLYHSAYKELATQYKKIYGFSANLPETPSMWRLSESANNTPNSTPATTPVSPGEPPHLQFAEPSNSGIRKRLYQFFSPVSTPQICPEEVKRLMCAVSFGYGLFHLCVSLLPTSALRFVHILGFASDRKVGIEALMFSRSGPDMRAPLASLALLWYHTVVNPSFIHFNSDDLSTSVEEAEAIINESNHEFSESSIFLFFKARLYRLKKKIDEAVSTYTKAVKYSGIRELAVLCLHEVGWCYLMQLEFQKALKSFNQLKKNESIKHLYSYLAALCHGCMDDMNMVAVMSQNIKLIEMEKQCELDPKISRRSGLLMPPKSPFYYRLLTYEMLYLWDSLPSQEDIIIIVQDCEDQGDPLKHSKNVDPIVGLRPLILGVCLGCLGRREEAINLLSSIRGQREKLVVDKGTRRGYRHIAAFAMYETAMLLMKEGNSREAKELLDTILHQYSSYDFENRLNFKIHSALKEIAAAS
ncbi:hypothetical protein GE061_007306 [Apolygus lucorum]|uniref:Uncharacterized protein n=1 Tax=Apolygus lucorum TaxID=248454 RepID=A0A6A4IZC5_APOLU|nr:hypothetical protein GE061_007306 [Apolygus lucorum]